MGFIVEYFKVIDLFRPRWRLWRVPRWSGSGSVWLFVAGILVATWGAARVMGFS